MTNTDFPAEHSLVGSILGTAVGDSIGLPGEAISPRRQHLLYPDLTQHHFFFGKGMVSDDTEHTCIVVQALIASAGEPGRFTGKLAWGLRRWLLGLPAGVGFATLRAILKLWLGFPPKYAGVFSAGNGPAMRVAILGICYGHDTQKLREMVKICTRMTHTDPKAEYGAVAVAVAAYLASRQGAGTITPQQYWHHLQSVMPDASAEFVKLMQSTIDSVAASESTEQLVRKLGLTHGVSGYIYHTIPVVIHSWLTAPKDYQRAITTVVRCGGDTDTTAAILGGIVGAATGEEGIPPAWLHNLWEWPRSVGWMRELGKRLHQVVVTGKPQRPLPVSRLGILIRNVFFLGVVLGHGLRRLLPPY